MLNKFFVILFMLCASASFAAVDVNKASSAELDSVKGIGPSISTKILDERKKGNFKDWGDFIGRVKGIGEGNSARFSAEGLTVNGASFKGAAPTAAVAPVAKAVVPTAPKGTTPTNMDAKPTTKEEVKDPKASAKQSKAEEKAKK